jgi:hypothetical protein
MTDSKTTRSGSVHEEMESEKDKAMRAQLFANPSRKSSISNGVGKDKDGKEGNSTASGHMSPLSLSSNSITTPISAEV